MCLKLLKCPSVHGKHSGNGHDGEFERGEGMPHPRDCKVKPGPGVREKKPPVGTQPWDTYIYFPFQMLS